MSSVLCNMKRVSIAFLPFMPVFFRARVLKTPPYTTISYATPFNNKSYTQPLNTACQQFSIRESARDITISLTRLRLYIFTRLSQTKIYIRLKMWTVTRTISNNKKRFVTLATPLNKFASITSSELIVNRWMRKGNVALNISTNTQNK